jgi:hypothetical protein
MATPVFVSKEICHVFYFVAPFPAGVAVDAVRVVPLLRGAAVGAAPLDPAAARVPAGCHHRIDGRRPQRTGAII